MSFKFNPFTGKFDQVGAGGGGGGSGAFTVYGSEGAPIVENGVASIVLGGDQRELRFLKSSGGEVTVAVSPQIPVGALVGAELLLTGVNDVDYMKFVDGSGLLLNGAVLLKSGQSILLFWTGSVWKEISRS